ncbi:MAG: hypothetical protein Q7S02_01390 [bacterium]|nr:hypothetical protein [bacterium]
MIACTPIPTTGTSRGRTHTIAIPLTSPRLGDARFFAVITGDRDPHPATDARMIANVATAVENVATTDARAVRSAGDAHEWLGTYVTHLRQQLDPAHVVGVSACLGIAAPVGDRTAITIACTGGLGALVVARSTNGTSRTIPIVEPQPTANGLQFPHAVDGTIGPHDVVVVGSRTIFDEPRRSDAIARAFHEHSIPDAIAVLRSLPPESGFHGMVIANASAAQEEARSQSSMHAFLATAASTERFLTPTLGPVLRAYGANVRSMVASLTRRKRHSRSRARPRMLPLLLEVIRMALRTIAVGARSVAAIAIDGLRLMGIASVRVVRAARSLRVRIPSTTNHLPRESLHPRHVIARGKTILVRGQSWYRSLPPLSQRLFLLTIAFAALFLISTGALWRRRAVDTDVAAYNATIASIEELRSVAEARMLFNDRAAARTALAEATTHLGTLPRTSRARRERAALLESELQASFDRARMVTRLPQPLLVARANDKIPFPTIGGVVLLDRDLAAVSHDGRRLALINPRTGAITLRELGTEHPVDVPFRTVAIDDRSLLILDAHARAAIIDSRDGTVQTITIEQPPTEVRDAAIYQSRLYLLHGDGSITRHTRTAAGFARGTQWLDPARALANARTLIVAGPIVVSADDGAVALYAAGRRKDVDLLTNVDPPLQSAVHVVASADGNVLYFGDPGEGRIIAVNTTGDLIGQIQSNHFRGLSNLALDTNGTSLYVWHGESISVVVPPKQTK